MHPPGPGNGKAGCFSEQSGPREKLNSDCADRIADSTREGKLWSKTGEKLNSAGIRFDWSRAGHDIVLVCLCEGKLVMHDSKPWHHCFGDLRCRARTMTFQQVVEALVEKVGKA